MDKKILNEECAYLDDVQISIDENIKSRKEKISDNKKQIITLKKYFTENFYDIKKDGDELADININIEHLETRNTTLSLEEKKLAKQKSTPYFGRFDFAQKNEKSAKPYYIGLGFVQDENQNNLVYDWRADVCSLYYDDQIGKNSYTCPEGEIEGEIALKRQFKIRDGKLDYYIDSNMIIDDDILMEQLSQNSGEKMHDIVSTIQKEQNKLVRADDFENMLIQGVAGSGKTSIAMHRVSYLLYKYRKSLKSEDILILSPSEMFGNYIDEVLPALGEETTFTTTFSNMAKKLLGLPFQSREDMLEHVITKKSQKDFENIAIKSSFEFLQELKNFLKKDIANLFIPKTLVFGEITFTKEELGEIFFNKLGTIAVHKRIDALCEYIVDQFQEYFARKEELLARAKKILYNKFMTVDLVRIYNLFLRQAEMEEIKTIGSYDVAPILLIKECLFGLKNNFASKYVIVDEMQDYTPCHFYLFDKIWKCPKFYLGDIYQSIDKTLSPDYLTSLAKMTKAKIKHLTKSYRSTLQISLFSQKILGKQVANNVNRVGEEVSFVKTDDCAKEIESILTSRNADPALAKQSVAIICKTNDEIKTLKKSSKFLKDFKILGSDSGDNLSKFVITTAAKAKGVEFDCVIVPFSNQENYSNELDRNLLYVSSTRALHKLYFVCDQTPSVFLKKSNK